MRFSFNFTYLQSSFSTKLFGSYRSAQNGLAPTQPISLFPKTNNQPVESSTTSNLGCQTLKDLPKTILTPSKKANFRDLKHPCEIQVKIGGSQLMGCFPPISVGQHRWTSPVVFVMEKPSHPELGQCSKRLRALFALAFWRPRAKWIFSRKWVFGVGTYVGRRWWSCWDIMLFFFSWWNWFTFFEAFFFVFENPNELIWTLGKGMEKKGAAFCSTIFMPKFTMRSKPHGTPVLFWGQVLTWKWSEKWE